MFFEKFFFNIVIVDVFQCFYFIINVIIDYSF